MKVKELLERLTYCNQDYEVVIPVMGDSLGSTPSVGIVSLWGGIDWDMNRVFLKTTERIVCAKDIKADLTIKPTPTQQDSVISSEESR